MKYAVLFSLVLAGAFAQNPAPVSPENINLPNGRKWSDVIAQADHDRNLKDARDLAQLTAEIQEDIENGDKFVLSVKTLQKLEEAEKRVKDLKKRMRKN
jgi:hypothetical protein